MSTQTETEIQKNVQENPTVEIQNGYKAVSSASPGDSPPETATSSTDLIIPTDDMRQASTDSMTEPTPSDKTYASSIRNVHFTSESPNVADSKRESNFSATDVNPISITAPLSNPNSNSHTFPASPNEVDKRVNDILEKHADITTKSQTMRELQYLHSLRVKDNLFHHHTNDGKSFFDSGAQIISTPNISERKEDLQLEDIEEEVRINEKLSKWTLSFNSAIREKQFRAFVTERYGTSIRVAILAIIVAYIFLAGTHGSFVKDKVRLIFCCVGLLVMLITFSLSSSYSRASSSATISYIKSLFAESTQQTNANNDDKQSDDKAIRKQATETSEWGFYLQSLFALHSRSMMALCVLILLYLLILQNVIGGGSLSDHQFIVYYLLSLLVTTTYGSIGYGVYLACAWTAWLTWNVLAITMQSLGMFGPFDFSFVNISLIIGQLVMGHQVKAKDLSRRKSFLRAMSHVHGMHRANNLDITSPKTANRFTPRRTPSTYATDYKHLDIVSDPTIRDKLSTAILEGVVEKAFGVSPVSGFSKRVSGSGSNQVITQYPSNYSIAQGSPMTRKKPAHSRKKSKIYTDIKRELTRRSTEHATTTTGRMSALGTKLGLGKRDGSGLGIWGVIRGIGGNLAHLESHDEDEETDFMDAGHHAIQYSAQLKDASKLSRNVSAATDVEEKEKETISEMEARVLATVVSQKVLKENVSDDIKVDLDPQAIKLLFVDSVANTEPHCGSFHELPDWYTKTVDSYILTGYRLNYSPSLCLKSMFQKHNETANIWTELVPAMILVALVVYFNVEDGHFWATSDVHDALTKAILYLAMPFIIIRPIISGFAHTFSAISKRASKIWWKLDFLSIILGAGAGSMIWIHCIFYCDKNLQTLYLFAIVALAFSTTMTALTTKSPVIRDLSLGAYFVFVLIFIYFYELYILYITNAPENVVPKTAMIYWTLSVACTGCAALFRASKYPEAIFVQARFKKLMEKTFEEHFAIKLAERNKAAADNIPNVTDDKETQTSFKQQVSFAKMLEDIQSYRCAHENRMANIEKMETHLYDNPDTKVVESKKQILEQEIENFENEIMNEIKNEIRVEECMEMAYAELISDDRKQWFNYIFTSHNFWHIFMNLSVMLSVAAWREYFNWRAMEQNWC